jgi:two-component system, sensor histidine kinase
VAGAVSPFLSRIAWSQEPLVESPSVRRSSHLTDDVVYALDALIRVVERHSGEFVASVLLLSDDGGHVLDAAAPGLPAFYRDAIHGVAIGPGVGSCGTAAYLNERVVVSDIASDPLWTDFRDVAAEADLAACWSQPIRDSAGEVLGTFALYYRSPRSPSGEELAIIEAAARRAGILLERAGAGARREELVPDLV